MWRSDQGCMKNIGAAALLLENLAEHEAKVHIMLSESMIKRN